MRNSFLLLAVINQAPRNQRRNHPEQATSGRQQESLITNHGQQKVSDPYSSFFVFVFFFLIFF